VGWRYGDVSVAEYVQLKTRIATSWHRFVCSFPPPASTFRTLLVTWEKSCLELTLTFSSQLPFAEEERWTECSLQPFATHLIFLLPSILAERKDRSDCSDTESSSLSWRFVFISYHTPLYFTSSFLLKMFSCDHSHRPSQIGVRLVTKQLFHIR
jgi:hypothetical protein